MIRGSETYSGGSLFDADVNKGRVSAFERALKVGEVHSGDFQPSEFLFVTDHEENLVRRIPSLIKSNPSCHSIVLLL